jgi:hypothetical protein
MKSVVWVVVLTVLVGACGRSANDPSGGPSCPSNVAWVYPPLPPLNSALFQFAQSHLGQTVGTGECAEVPELGLRQYGGATIEELGTTHIAGDYVWGDLVDTVTLGSPRLIQVIPGDVIQYADADFRWQVAANAWETDVADHHTAVVAAVSADGANVCVFQQNSGGKRYVMYGYYEVAGITSGVLHVYRPRPRAVAPMRAVMPP